MKKNAKSGIGGGRDCNVDMDGCIMKETSEDVDINGWHGTLGGGEIGTGMLEGIANVAQWRREHCC